MSNRVERPWKHQTFLRLWAQKWCKTCPDDGQHSLRNSAKRHSKPVVRWLGRGGGRVCPFYLYKMKLHMHLTNNLQKPLGHIQLLLWSLFWPLATRLLDHLTCQSSSDNVFLYQTSRKIFELRWTFGAFRRTYDWIWKFTGVTSEFRKSCCTIAAVRCIPGKPRQKDTDAYGPI